MAANRAAAEAVKQVVREVNPERVAKLSTFFARASVATRLLHSRLALPITYPLHTSAIGTLPDGKENWKEDEIKRGLAHVTPIVAGMAKVAPLLKAAQALSHYQGGQARHVAPNPEVEKADEVDIRLNTIRPHRLKGGSRGRRQGYIATKTGKGLGWDDVSSGRTVDSPLHRFANEPIEDTPKMSHMLGKEYASKTKWDKRKSGSQ
mmetsp:Transcript_15292/g.41888  ORF Transcript_15292/g.41888 Transcript_15292/m.41888 type:complete len:206 (-) Transcript_15292:59-676(-)